MKKFGIKNATWYGLLVFLVAVALLPLLKAAAPQYFPGFEGFRNVDCKGVTCPEGQFCQNNSCISITARGGSVPTGDVMN